MIKITNNIIFKLHPSVAELRLIFIKSNQSCVFKYKIVFHSLFDVKIRINVKFDECRIEDDRSQRSKYSLFIVLF